MSIDWSKAPEGATHYDTQYDFFCNESGFYDSNEMYIKDEQCGWGTDRYIPRPTTRRQCEQDAFSEAVRAQMDREWDEMQKQSDKLRKEGEWNGEGLPPVGTKCFNREGSEGVIVAHVTDSNGDIEAIMQCSDDWYICGDGDAKPINPIKSERDRQIDALLSVIQTLPINGNSAAIAQKLYDKGVMVEI